MKPLGIYIHIPFCVRRCPYCGFYSTVLKDDLDIHSYFGDLLKELDIRSRDAGNDYEVDSIYFGGGTPSLADPSDIGRMIEAIREKFPVTGDAEISMEANPGTLDPEKLKGFREAGVNRLSIGLQSFDDEILKVLGRIHTAEDFMESYRAARDAGFENINTDLMFAVPGMSTDIWASTVGKIIDTDPEHVSIYSLQIEEGTAFYDAYRRGDLNALDDEVDRDMYHEALNMLEAAGYKRYEISNLAKPGRECRANMKYWTFADYLGLGAGASSFMNGVRTTNVTTEYLDVMSGISSQATPSQGTGSSAEPSNVTATSAESSNVTASPAEPSKASAAPRDLFSEYHVNTLQDSEGEYMFTGLRTSAGIDEEDFIKRFGKPWDEVYRDELPELDEFFDGGYIKRDAGRLFLTGKGIDISNKIMSCFV